MMLCDSIRKATGVTKYRHRCLANAVFNGFTRSVNVQFSTQVSELNVAKNDLRALTLGTADAPRLVKSFEKVAFATLAAHIDKLLRRLNYGPLVWTDIAMQIWKLSKRRRTAVMSELRKAKIVQSDEVLKLAVSRFTDQQGLLSPIALVYCLQLFSRTGLDRAVLNLAELALSSGYDDANTEIYSALIRSYAHNGLPDTALALFNSLPDEFRTRRQALHVFSGLANSDRFPDAMRFLQRATKIPHIKGDTSLFENAFFACPELVAPLWREIIAEKVTLTTGILCEATKACMETNRGVEAADMVQTAITKGVEVPNTAFTNAFSACRKDTRADKASIACRELLLCFREAIDKKKASQAVYHAAIAAAIAYGHVDLAEALLQDMKAAKLSYDQITLNSLCIPQRANSDKVSQAKLFDLLKEVMEAGARPDVATMESMLDSCRRSNEVELALQLFELFTTSNVKPSLTAFNYLIDTFIKHNQLEPAKKCFDAITQGGLKPNRWTYSAMIKGLVQANKMDEAHALVDDALRADQFTLEVVENDGYTSAQLNLEKVSHETSELVLERAIAAMKEEEPQARVPLVATINTTGKPHFTDALRIYETLSQKDPSLKLRLQKQSAVKYKLTIQVQ